MKVSELGEFVYNEAGKVIAGQEEALEQILVCLLARGHVLLEGVPGIAKTLAVRTIAFVLGCDSKRVQFTPDLMPSDITGTYVFDSKTASFHLRKGPIFTNLLLADEINRTPPKTQSALLQAMEERCVSIDGTDHSLEGIFFVAATQNPIEYEGTYPLPEAQLDRFLMKVVIGYPDAGSELEVLRRSHAGFDPHDLSTAKLTSLPSPEAVSAAWAEVQAVKVDEEVMRYAAALARATREAYQVILGASPRASIALLRCSKALAALRGREYVTPDDIKALALPIMRHRVILSPESAIEGVRADEVISGVVASIPVPR
ncbi:MAG TPA: MoxR family ATPase [Armatimonadota bacterium]|nr:MoxR family ATPase [Armatimonadota bacterium]